MKHHFLYSSLPLLPLLCIESSQPYMGSQAPLVCPPVRILFGTCLYLPCLNVSSTFNSLTRHTVAFLWEPFFTSSCSLLLWSPCITVAPWEWILNSALLMCLSSSFRKIEEWGQEGFLIFYILHSNTTFLDIYTYFIFLVLCTFHFILFYFLFIVYIKEFFLIYILNVNSGPWTSII